MELLVNGEPRQVEDGTTVAALVQLLGLPERGVAVALDDRVVPRSTWEQAIVTAGQRVEVLTAVQGG